MLLEISVIVNVFYALYIFFLLYEERDTTDNGKWYEYKEQEHAANYTHDMWLCDCDLCRVYRLQWELEGYKILSGK